MMIVFIILFFGTATALPWVLPRYGVELPPSLTPTVVWLLTAVMWLLITPTFMGIMVLWDRMAKQVGPGAIIDKSTGDLLLPWMDSTVPESQIHYFVEMNGRHRYGGRNSQVGQYSVLFEDDRGRIYLAPMARLNTKILGKTSLDRVAEYYSKKVKKVRLSYKKG